MIDDFPAEWLLYLRKSVGYAGIERQRSATTGMVTRRGGKVAMTFDDADKTAYRNTHRDIDAPLPPRPGFDALLAELARRPGVGVAMWHADRGARDPEAAEAFIRACRRDGGHLIATKAGGDYDVTTSNGRSHLRADINAANDEVDHGVERMLEAKAEAAGDGRWLGGPRPFGWEPDPAPRDDDGEPVLDSGGNPAKGYLRLMEAEAAAIEAASRDVLAGASVYGITAAWRAAGFTGTRGGELSPADVRAILLRPRNAGLMEHRGQLVDLGGERRAKWPAIVGEPTWRAVRAILSDARRRTSPGPEPRHLLCGIALCGTCGAPLTTRSRGAGRDFAYRCSLAARNLPRRPGPHAGHHGRSLDDFIAALAVGRLKQDDAALLLRADHSGDRAALLAADAAAKAEYDEQWELYRAKAITARELAEGRAAIEAERGKVAAALAALEEADAVAPFLASPGRAWRDAPLDRRRALASALVHVTVFAGSQAGPGASLDQVDVRWKRRLPSDG